MKKIKVTNNLYQYQFEPSENRILGQNIYVLYHRDECVVFDAGYEIHMEQLYKELKDYNIKNVICTHYHPDHCYGLNVIPKQSTIGSINSIDTLRYFEQSDNKKIVPDTMIEKDTIIAFYDHTIKLIPTEGHSKCGLLILIDDKYLLTADEFMTSNDGQPVLPYVADTVQQHISSLQKIVNNFSGLTYLPAHGVIQEHLDGYKRCLGYLEFCLTGDKKINHFYDGTYTFLHEEWHLLNIKKK